MRIAYSAFIPDIRRETGVLKKIRDQLRAWQAEGHEARLFAVTRAPANQPAISHVEVVGGFRSWNLPLKGRTHVAQILDWAPALVYVRYGVYYPAFDRLTSRVPVVVEINSDDLRERALKSRAGLVARLKQVYNRATRGRLFKRAAAFVCVTGELAGRFGDFGKPTLVSGNGIDLRRIPQTPAPTNLVPHLFFMNSPDSRWGGEDQVLALARAFPQWRFDVVGYTADELGGATVPQNVTGHGFLPREAYRHLLARADVALGTLCLYRKKMDEASPLKVREYLAAGVATIIGYHDTDFPHRPPFLLELPNAPNNIQDHLEQIRHFVLRWKGVRIQHGDVDHLDTQVKEKDRLRFLKGVLERRVEAVVPSPGNAKSKFLGKP